MIEIQSLNKELINLCVELNTLRAQIHQEFKNGRYFSASQIALLRTKALATQAEVLARKFIPNE